MGYRKGNRDMTRTEKNAANLYEALYDILDMIGGLSNINELIQIGFDEKRAKEILMLIHLNAESAYDA